MSTFSATPRCRVDIYPYEGGKYYAISGDSGRILSAVVSKSIRTSSAGTFSLILAPGGPNGPNASPSWLEIITPMSFVTISMQRYNHAQTVMVGVVLNIQESVQWNPEQGVVRSVEITGQDLQYFFNVFSYYTLSFLGTVAGAGVGAQGLPALQGKYALQGRPEQVGATWYDIMAGPKGIMAQTTLPVGSSNGTVNNATFSSLMATWFQPFMDSTQSIPMGENFLFSDGNWLSKFQKIFPFPWYEMFVITAPVGFYSPPKVGGQQPGYTPATLPISVPGFPPVSPQLVARTNPLPWATVNGTSQLFTNKALWDALPPPYTVEGGVFRSSVTFSETEVRNFYILNPTWMRAQMGDSNTNINPFIFTYSGWEDLASVHRYGFRPEIAELHWLADVQGSQAINLAAQSSMPSFANMVANITLRLASYHEPVSSMAYGTVSMELRPDIMPGCVFNYQPFKIGENWDFYISGISHSYVFGGPSQTQLSLSRGLPHSVYEDPKMLLYLNTGRAIRQDGQYKSTGATEYPVSVAGVSITSASGLIPVDLKTASSPAFLTANAIAFTGAGKR